MQQLGVWCALVAHSVTFFKLHRWWSEAGGGRRLIGLVR
jgi:hypothetical protein